MERCSESQVPILEDSSSGVKMSSSSSSSLTSSSDGKGKRNSGNFYLGDDEEENKRNQILAHLTDPNESSKKDDVHSNKLKDEHELLLPIPAINCVNTDGEMIKGNGYLRHGDGSPRHSHGEFDGKSVPMRTIHSAASISRHHQLQTLTLPCDNWRNSAEEALLAKQAIAILRRGDTTPNSIYPHPHIITHSQSYHLGNHSHNVSPHSCNSSHFGNRRHHPKSSSAGATRALEEADKAYSKRAGNNALGLVLSALYGKILVVMGIAFPMSEVISTYIPPSFYDGFYLYLYFGSITFMICILGNILRERATKSVRGTIKRISTMRSRLAPGNAGIAPDVTTTERQEHSCESEGSFSESPLPSGIDSAVARAKLNRLSRVGSENGIDPLNLDDLGLLSNSEIHFGSFYLRMGAVAFGIGSMIYSGLEFGQYFELEPDTKCHNVLIALTPSVRMIFTFMQMYFVFLNSKIDVNKVRLGAQFGLMHMIGTNLCVWLNVLIQETRHEILQFYNPDNNTVNIHHGTQLSAHKPHGRGTLSGAHQGHPVKYGGGHGGGHGAPTLKPTLMATAAAITTTAKLPHVVPKIATATSKSKLLASIVPTVAATTSKTIATVVPTMAVVTLRNVTEVVANATTAAVNTTVTTILQRERRGLKGPHSIYECRRTDIMGALVQNASPFMFPCTIEYSLICAAILYVMWKSMARPRKHFPRTASIYHHGEFHLIAGAKRSPHYYSVDCARANKGLFLGIFVLVLTIISLILFFVLITRRDYEALALLEVNITELVLYTTTTVAVLIGMCQVRELRYDCRRNLELDNILLIVAQTGSFIYNVFTIIGGHFTMKKNSVLVLMTALASLVQLLFQTIFILDASKRVVATADQVRRKPGREVITFLLVTNLAMWAINTLEKSRADSHPVQLRFYGVWAWTIITHISMPLAIFYRFHSTVCLCEIWKRAYKIKHSPNFISL